MTLSALGFSLMAVCVKEVGTYGIPVLEIIFARAIVSLIISYLDVKRKGISIWGNNKSLLVSRGLVGSFALVCVYYSITHLPLAEATLLQYLYPAFTALIALFFLKEKIHISTIICIILSLIGLFIMVNPETILDDTRIDDKLSIFIALIGSLGIAVAYILVKRLSQTEDTSVIIFYFPLIAIPVSLLLPSDAFVMPSIEALGLLLLVGVFTQVGQVGLTKALANGAASQVTAYSYIQIVFSICLGWILFLEVPSIYTWIGGGMIILGALINTLWRR